jgi:hypothetical protein
MKKFVAAIGLLALSAPLFAALPVVPVAASRQKDLLKSDDARLAVYKKIACDFPHRRRRLDLSGSI